VRAVSLDDRCAISASIAGTVVSHCAADAEVLFSLLSHLSVLGMLLLMLLRVESKAFTEYRVRF